MLGGGNWYKQNKILHGVYVNFVSKNSSGRKKNTNADVPETPDVPVVPDIPVGYGYLMDQTGACFVTSDGKYLIVKEI